jgi:hypothetical protein
MNSFDKFLKRVSWKFPKGYPDINNEQDKKLLFEMAHSILGEVEEEVKQGYKIGEFTTPSETLASRNWNFNSKVGYLGTGHYFYGDEETALEDRRFLGRSADIKKFPLSDYKLFRASDPEKFYDNIKLITRELGLYASSEEELSGPELDEALEEIYSIIKDDLGLSISKETAFDVLKGFISDIQNRKDGPLLSNRLLQPLGYEGIDNTNTNLDNYGVGSVIFADKKKLEELDYNEHWKERIQERSNILDIINLTSDITGEYPVKEVKTNLIKAIQEELITRCDRLEAVKDIPASADSTLAYKIIKPILIANGKTYDLMMFTQSTKEDTVKDNYGTYYYAPIRKNFIHTLILTRDDDEALEKQSSSHIARVTGKSLPSKIFTPTNFEFKINLDELMGNAPEETKLTVDELPYTIRTDYRKGATFTHNDYGTGTIITTSNGNSGKGDLLGKLDWVEVDFGKPYVSKGELKKTRIINNIYTTASPLVKA